MKKHKSEKKTPRPAARAEPAERRSLIWYTDGDGMQTLECAGYTSLAHSPEVTTAVNTIARLIGAMTIHLMQNTESGDVRVVNELSRVVDINPTPTMNRSNFITWIIKTLFIEGRGNAVVMPITENGYLRRLQPIPAAYTGFIPSGSFDYKITIAGREYEPDELLHFVLNPNDFYTWMGDGYTVTLRDVANNLKQAATTERGFMSSKWKPSLIVKVDALTDEFSSPSGRKRLLEEYASSGEAGEPWLIPAEQFDIQQVKPLTLSDLALADFVEIDKRTIASILGVPAFILGAGEFSRDEWNSFISTTIMPLAQGIQQELTRKLLYSPDLYFRFNSRALYNYDMSELATVADNQYIRGIMTGNEVRDWIGLGPLEGLDNLVVLENYIPVDKIGDQKKLIQGEGGENGDI